MVQLQLAFSAETANSTAPTASVESLPLTAVKPPTTPLEKDSLPEEIREWALPDAEELASSGTSPSSHKPSQKTPSPTAPPSRSAQRSLSAQPKSHHEMSLLNQKKPTQRRYSLSLTLRKQLLKIHRLSQSPPANRCKPHLNPSRSNSNRDPMSPHNKTHHRWSSLLRSHHQPDFHKSLHNNLRGPHQQPLQQTKRRPIHRCL